METSRGKVYTSGKIEERKSHNKGAFGQDRLIIYLWILIYYGTPEINRKKEKYKYLHFITGGSGLAPQIYVKDLKDMIQLIDKRTPE